MGHSVLIVDDSATLRAMVRRTLALTGLDIGATYEAANGIEALARLGDHEVAVMLVDINMPLMNGMQLLRRMKDDPRICDVPVVVASTEGSDQRIAELQALGIAGYVRKPFQPEQLRDVLLPLLGEAKHVGAECLDPESDAF